MSSILVLPNKNHFLFVLGNTCKCLIMFNVSPWEFQGMPSYHSERISNLLQIRIRTKYKSLAFLRIYRECPGKLHTVPNWQIDQIENGFHEQWLHISVQCSFDTKHHSTYRVSTLGKLTIAAEAFLWDEAPMPGKYEFCWLCWNLFSNRNGNRNVPVDGKIVIFLRDFLQSYPVVQQAARASTVSKTLKDVASRIMFKFMRECWRVRDAQGKIICKAFGCEQDELAQCQKH